MSDPKAVEITAELRQVKSMADHSFNVILNVPEYCLPMVQTLMGWLGDEIGVVMVNGGNNLIAGEEQDGSRTRRKRTVRKGE